MLADSKSPATGLEADGTGNRSPEQPAKQTNRRGSTASPRSRRVSVRTYDDHRMAMSFAIAGLRVPLEIEHPECVSKSYPTFWEYWERL